MESAKNFVDQEELVSLTQELIKINSVYRPETEDGNEEKVAKFVVDYLKEMNLTVHYEGLMIGIKDFIKNGWAKGVDGAIICEPEENQLYIYQKGAMRAVIKTYGNSNYFSCTRKRRTTNKCNA